MDADMERDEFDKNYDNGLAIGNIYLPEELLAEILLHIHHRTLLNCQLVCKRWNTLLKHYVWRKKAELIVGRPLPSGENFPWSVYYVICKKNPFGRNLIRNHSGKKGVKKYWQVLSNGGDGWHVECPPCGVPPLPSDEPVFEGQQSCFVTSYGNCYKVQIIDLVAIGLTPHLLDYLQPPITVSEWYSSRWDCGSDYECSIKLLGKEKRVLDSFERHDSINDVRLHQWFHVSHVFENYGVGVRTIKFRHGGKDKRFWSGHYGCKMAGACVRVDIPEVQRSNIVPSAPLDLEQPGPA